jgi:hypothetical protein
MDDRMIFTDDSDRDNLVGRLALLLPETRTACYAWAFLPDHAHFLLRSGPEGISRLMQRLLTGYARCFNRRHRRVGALFHKRYKSFAFRWTPEARYVIWRCATWASVTPIWPNAWDDPAGDQLCG